MQRLLDERTAQLSLVFSQQIRRMRCAHEAELAKVAEQCASDVAVVAEALQKQLLYQERIQDALARARDEIDSLKSKLYE